MLLLTACLALGGCFGTGVFRANGGDAVLFDEISYDGAGAVRVEGLFQVELDAAKNTGYLRLHYHDQVRTHEFRFDNFSARAPYQSGGVARDVALWGDSGNGSALFPRVHAYVAAFGSSTYSIDARPQPDPTNLAPRFPAVFFIARGQYRDNETHRVQAADRQSLYDPQNPDDAYVSQIGAQAALLLYTARGDLYRYVEFNDVRVGRS